MYYLRSSVRNLSPRKQRDAQDRIVAGVKIHSRVGTFVVSEMALFENFGEIMKLLGLGELQVMDEKGTIPTDDLKKARTEWVRKTSPKPAVATPVAVEPEPEPEPESEAEPAEDEPVDEPVDEEKVYSLDDLNGMTKNELLALAKELGTEVGSKDRHDKLVKKIWKSLS